MSLEYKILTIIGYVALFFLGYQLGRLIEVLRQWRQMR